MSARNLPDHYFDESIRKKSFKNLSKETTNSSIYDPHHMAQQNSHTTMKGIMYDYITTSK